ncbi:MAG: nickel-responsive transcriptional regulator NikR [Desulfobacterales bacterium]|nr:nickel-responsive transcriptional regulator NikR [Desulfobacterales bacterium]
MSGISRFGISINSSLLEAFDKLIGAKGCTNRSEAIRDLIREHLVENEWQEEDRETVGAITLVYNHHLRELPEKLAELQHQDFNFIISALHVHLDEFNCLEVLVVKGQSRNIKKIADRLIGTKGVKHGKLTMTTRGKDLT